MDLCQAVFRQTDHFHDGAAVDAVLQHGSGNFELAFFDTTLLTQLNPLL